MNSKAQSSKNANQTGNQVFIVYLNFKLITLYAKMQNDDKLILALNSPKIILFFSEKVCEILVILAELHPWQ